MKKLLSIAAIAVAALGMTACSPISEGVVTDKVVHEEWTEMKTVCISTDYKTGTCKSSMIQPFTHPERYELKLRSGDKEGFVYVNKAEFAEWDKLEYFTTDK